MPKTSSRFAWVVLCALGLGACVDVPVDPRPVAWQPTVGATRAIVPGPGLPPEYTSVRDALGALSNNNLDVVRHAGQVFLATRLSRDHFASPDSSIFVFASDDEQTWRFEARFSVGTDVREPRFLSYRGALFLFFAKLGTNPIGFEPRGMLVTERLDPARWSTPADFYRGGQPYIPWRAKERSGRALLITYRDGQHIYDFSGQPMDIELLTSSDGRTFAPLRGDGAPVLTGGGSETDFDFDDHGDLFAVVRNEAGDASGYGSKICTAAAADLGTWRCRSDAKKYDSPIVFRHRDRILLIGRRNVTDTGDYALHPDAPWSPGESATNLLDYSNHPKRCALWEVDRATLTVRHVLDVPGWGDTCFPSLLYPESESPAGVESPAAQGPRPLILYNYSSPLDDAENGERSWSEAQKGETRIYRTELLMP